MSSERWPSLIAGDWVGSTTRDWFEVHDPAHHANVVALAPEMGCEDVARAVEAAEDGFKEWRQVPIIERAAVLTRAAQLLRDRADSIAKTVTLEMGKTIAESTGEVNKAADFFDYYASFARLPVGQVLPDARRGAQVYVLREPVGRVVAIAPWNDPVITPARKLAPALISGNSVVLKPAPESPLSGILLARVLIDAGIPPKALNVVTGSSDTVGKDLVASGAFEALSFTGSNAVGGILEAELAGRNIRFEAEMGGKNCAVVTRSADLDAVIPILVSGAFAQAGQRCTATSRLLVDSEVRDALLGRLLASTAALRVGPGLLSDTQVGPMVSTDRVQVTISHLTAAIDNGAKLAIGGTEYTAGECEYGSFLAPAVITEVPEGSSVWDDELFAPVLAVRTVSSTEDAIEEVNASDYGLSAAIFTDSLEEADAFVSKVDVGCVAVNLPTAGWDVHVPFGGFKASGSSQKEQGIQGLEFYTRWKSVAVQPSRLSHH